MSENNEVSTTSEAMSSEEQARRDFLMKAGRFAGVTAPAITLLLGTSLNSKAIASSSGTRPGFGFGDKNHQHIPTHGPGWLKNK